ncbi:hypothetical protein GIHI108528_14150 [Gillisia hiemivivida]
MNSYFEYTDLGSKQQFTSTKLGDSLFIYEEHFRLAYLHISNYSVKQDISYLSEQLFKNVCDLTAIDI